MSHAEAKRWLDRMMSDEWYASQMPISRRALTKAAGVQGIFNYEPTKNAWKALEAVIPKIENREVIFIPGDAFVVREPSGQWSVAKLTSRWSIDNRCNCGCNQFLPVMIEKEYAACYHCIPPSQYPAIGAKLIKRSLIHDAMKNYYIAE